MQSNNRKRTWDRSDTRQGRNRGRRNRRAGSSKPGRLQIYSQAGRQALRDVNTLRRFINTEMHFTDVTASVTPSTTPALVLLNGISIGDTASTRTGQSIKMDRSDFRFTLAVNTTSVSNFVRVIVVMDRQTNATAMTTADLLVVSTVVSPYSFGSQNRFVPLFDETYALNVSGPGSITKVIGLNTNQHVTYNTSNAGTVADIVTNSVYLIYFSDQATNPPSMLYYNRLWFVDN